MSKHRQKSIRTETTDLIEVDVKYWMDISVRLRGDKLNVLIKSLDEKDEGTQQLWGRTYNRIFRQLRTVEER